MSVGIYKIINKTTGHIYIGSTRVSFEERWKDHLYNLSTNRHENNFLQNHWNKYGRDGFDFCIIKEVLNNEDIISLEQKYIDEAIKELGRRKVYNVALRIGSFELNSLQGTAHDWVVVDPNNKIYIIDNLRAFCRIHGLLAASMANVARHSSRQRSNHEWLCYRADEFTQDKLTEDIERRDKSKIKRQYVVVDPQDKLYECDNLKAFCRQYNLTFVCMCKTLHRDKGPLWPNKGGWMAYYKDEFSQERLKLDRSRPDGRTMRHQRDKRSEETKKNMRAAWVRRKAKPQ